MLNVLDLLDRLRQDLRLLLEDAGLVIDVEIVIDDGVVPILIGEVIGPHLVVQILVVVLKTREFYINKAGTSFNVAYAPFQFLVHYIEWYFYVGIGSLPLVGWFLLSRSSC